MSDNVAVTAGSGTTVAADEVVDGTLGTVKVQFVKLMDGTLDGTTKVAAGANGLAVDVKAVVPGTAATNLGKAEDVAHTTGDTGVMMLAVRKDTAAALAGADGDYIPLITDASGRLWVMLPANSGVDIGDVDVTSVIAGTGATNLGKAEDVAHTTGDTGVMMLAVRKDTAAALATTDGDYIPLITDASGRLHVAPLVAGTANIGDVDVLSIAAGETLIGLVGASDIQVAVTPTMDTSAYTANDVWFTATEIAAAARVSGGSTILQSVTILDKDDQTAAAVDLYFFDRTVTLGTINNAVTISDADAAYYVGHVSIAAADWKDLINSKVACKAGIGLAMKANATSIFVAAVTAGTPTNTASGVYLKFSFLRS